MSIFYQACTFVIGMEGGHVNDPHDPGGETKFGISQRAYPRLSIGQLSKDDACEIYRKDYWDKVSGDDLPSRIAVAVFDCAVNQGVRRAKRLLQRALRVRVDGRIGPITRAAIASANEDALLLDFLSHRLRAYAGTRNSKRYMRGWSRRVLALHAFVLSSEFPR